MKSYKEIIENIHSQCVIQNITIGDLAKYPTNIYGFCDFFYDLFALNDSVRLNPFIKFLRTNSYLDQEILSKHKFLGFMWHMPENPDQIVLDELHEAIVFDIINSGVVWVKNEIFHLGSGDILYDDEGLNPDIPFGDQPFIVRNMVQRHIRTKREISSSTKPQLSTWLVNEVGVGNCGEHAAAAYVYAKHILGKGEYIAICASGVMDHSFVLVSNKPIKENLEKYVESINKKIPINTNEEIYVFDPWSQNYNEARFLSKCHFAYDTNGELVAPEVYKERCCNNIPLLNNESEIIPTLELRYNSKYQPKTSVQLQLEDDIKNMLQGCVKHLRKKLSQRYSDILPSEYKLTNKGSNIIRKYLYQKFSNFLTENAVSLDKKECQCLKNQMLALRMRCRFIKGKTLGSVMNMLSNTIKFEKDYANIKQTLNKDFYNQTQKELDNGPNSSNYSFDSNGKLFFNGKKQVVFYPAADY
ncbi:hypothetical protein [Facilibium subflavum]|uniref:hypothetical protein n=1 Tax=Facilibium subflavum TaxID=2219058 RepID=UPI000E656411|nr:hypothetical protein [Facilibium subflavum]